VAELHPEVLWELAVTLSASAPALLTLRGGA